MIKVIVLCLIAALGCCKELNLIVDSTRVRAYWMTLRHDLSKFLESRTNEHWTAQVIDMDSLKSSQELSELKGDFIADYTEQLLNRHEVEKAFNTSFENITQGGKPIVLKPRPNSSRVAADMLASTQAIITCFAWSRPLMLVENKYFVEMVESEFNQFSKLSVSSTSSQTDIEHLISREVRPTGIKQLFILANAPLTNKLLAALAKFEIESGYSIVSIGSDCIFDISLYPSRKQFVIRPRPDSS